MGDICYPDTTIWTPPTPAEGLDGPALELFETQLDLAQAFGWQTIQALSAFQVAICPITTRPRRKDGYWSSYMEAPVYGPGASPFFPFQMPSGEIVNVLWCSCRGDCLCPELQSEIILPGPVGAIDEVKIDGEVLTSTAYRVDNGNILVRQDGSRWPRCQDLSLPAGEVGTLTVTYWRGAKPDSMANYIAGILATEWMNLALNNKKCRLPKGTQTIIRQGVSYDISSTWFADGTTGILEVDQYIQRLNPYALKSPPMVMSPDVMPTRQTTFGG